VSRQTHTYSVLQVSGSAYDEIAERLKAAGYDQAFQSTTSFAPANGGIDVVEEVVIDMHGIALAHGVVKSPDAQPMPDQRSVSDQLHDLVKLANERGMYDAADWITRSAEKRA
jgi:hypothetical protein